MKTVVFILMFSRKSRLCAFSPLPPFGCWKSSDLQPMQPKNVNSQSWHLYLDTVESLGHIVYSRRKNAIKRTIASDVCKRNTLPVRLWHHYAAFQRVQQAETKNFIRCGNNAHCQHSRWRASDLKQSRSGFKHMHKGIRLIAHNFVRCTDSAGFVPLEVIQAVVCIEAIIALKVEKSGVVVAGRLCRLGGFPIVEKFCWRSDAG
jgi:hypothetical protein